MKSEPIPFIFTTDEHVGHEVTTVKGRRVTRPLHDAKAIAAVQAFARDFKPEVWILGGDTINCGSVSHWAKPRDLEGFRLKQELDLADRLVFSVIDDIIPKWGRKVWLEGNHENWIKQLLDRTPSLEGMIEPDVYLGLRDRGWDVKGSGEVARLGKLYFVHGDNLRGGNNLAASALNAYRRNIRLGHHHGYVAATASSMVDQECHTAIAVPCLGRLDPSYGNNAPNRHVQGFLYGWVMPNGNFTDNVIVMSDRRFIIGGKVYA